MISFACPRCSTPYKVDAEKAGMRTKCPECGSTLVVPQQRSDPAPAGKAASPLSPSPGEQQRSPLLLAVAGVAGGVVVILVVILVVVSAGRNTGVTPSSRPGQPPLSDASSLTPDQFLKIQAGMDPSAVELILGRGPDENHPNPTTGYTWKIWREGHKVIEIGFRPQDGPRGPLKVDVVRQEGLK